MSSAAWPNLFVVGAGRCGTTSLWAYLGQHPDIFMSELKEPSFFSRYEHPFRYVHDERAYLRLFSKGAGNKYRGEASPSYLWHEGTPAEIRRVSPDTRILISLRDPIERAYSAFRLRTRQKRERRPFLEAIRSEIAKPPAEAKPLFYTGWSLYADSVSRYLDTFGENVRVLIFEEFIADVRGHLRGIFSFLEIDPSVTDRMRTERFSNSAKPRNLAAAGILNSRAIRRAAGALVPLRYRPIVESALLSPQGVRPEIDPEATRLLRELFAEDVARVEKLLGRSVPWPTARALSSTREARSSAASR